MRPNVIQLREMLREKFPGLRLSARTPAEETLAVWPTGLPQLDEPLEGGLPKGGLTELVCPHATCGGALVLEAVLRHALAANQIVTLIDGQDSFDPAPFAADLLARLLWVRCREADRALKAADLVLRDANLPLVLLDLALNPPAQLQKISASTWHRFRRLTEQTATTLLVVTPRQLVSGADVRWQLHGKFPLASLDESERELLAQLKFELIHRRSAKPPETAVAKAG